MTPFRRVTADAPVATGRLVLVGGGIATVLVALFLHLPLRGAGFIQDDHPIVERNPVVRGGDVARVFSSDWWSGVGGGDPGLYRPFTLLSFVLQRGPDGSVDPARAHDANAVLHALTALALLVLVRRSGTGPLTSGAAGLIFAAHPVHLAAIAPLVGRAEILATLFALAAILAIDAATPRSDRAAMTPMRRHVGAWTAASMTLLALGSKESAIALPFVLALHQLAAAREAAGPRAARLRDLASRLLPSAVAVAVFLAMRGRALGSLIATQKVLLADNPLVALEGLPRLATALGLAARAVGLFVWPATLSPDYSGNVIRAESGLLAPLPLAGLAVLTVPALLVLLPWLPRGRFRDRLGEPTRLRLLSLAASLFLLPYLVTGNLLVLVGVVFAERLLYLPSAGFCVLAVVLAGAIPLGRLGRAVGAAVALVAVVLLGGRTLSGTADWMTNERIWEAAARAAPDSPRAWFTLGKIRADQGRDDEALEMFDRTLDLWPAFSSAWFERGLLLAKRSDLDGASASFRATIERNPSHEGAAVELGRLLRRRGLADEAVRELTAARRRVGGSPAILAELGGALYDSGRADQAAAVLREALALGRGDVEPLLRRAESQARR